MVRKRDGSERRAFLINLEREFMSTQKLRESINFLVYSSLATISGVEAQHFASAALFVAQAVELLERPRVSEILSNVTVQSDVECEVVDESGVDLKTKLTTVATLPSNEVELLVYENPFAIVGIRGSVRRLTLVAGGLTLVITNAHCDLQKAWAKFVDPLDNSRTEMLLLALADIGISRRPQDFAFLGA